MLRQFIQLALTCAIITIASTTDTNYRLNSTIKPSAYSISIRPYFKTGDNREFTFDGEVTIKFVSDTNINRIKLHSDDLVFSGADISLTCGLTAVSLNANNPLEFEKNYTFAYINLQNEIISGVEYTLKIVYQGPIREDLSGFYRNYYIERGIKKWLGATQMEPTYARKVFPCFDEPELKAVFTLTIDRPDNYNPSLANTKLQNSVNLNNGYIRDTFSPTPRMSTYLVAFLVSEFEGVTITEGNNEFGVYSRPDAKNQSEYAFNFGQRVVKALGDYYGIDYYSTNNNLKLDHIALPDFKAGAMENWGLVKYRESLLLYLPEESTPYFKYRVAQIVAHETTHMWFGNLVTCHWWSDTWLNEGFANYFQDYITSLVEPNVGASDMLVIGSVYAAFEADDKPDSPPISNNNVNSPAEISSHFGTITYQKAGSVIRMMHHLMGDDAFKFGLNAYLTTNKFEAGYPDKLYTSLSDGVSRYNSLASYSGSDLKNIMSSWIAQSGYPILHVEVNHDDSSITLTQKRFYIESSHSSEEIYPIPITYTLDTNFNFGNTKPSFIMNSKTYVLPVREIKENHSTPIFNIQETGFYRVNYDSHTWSHIAQILNGKRREEIHYLNRAKFINDLFAFLYADEVKFDQVKDMLHFMQYEMEYPVWYAAIHGLNKLRKYYLGSDTLPLIDEFSLNLINNPISSLGYDVRQSDSYNDLRQRMLLLDFACKLGHQGCLDNTLTMYKNFKNNGDRIDPSLRSVAYCTGLRFGNGDDYDFLWNRMATTNVANEARIIGDILGCTTDKSKLNSYLVSMLVEDSPIRTQDLTVPLVSVLSNYSNVGIVLEALEQNVTSWKSIYTSLDTVLSTIASVLHSQDEFNHFENWLSTCSECGDQAVTAAKTALDKARKVTSWADNHRSDIWTSLRGDARMLSASSIIIISLIITLFNRF